MSKIFFFNDPIVRDIVKDLKLAGIPSAQIPSNKKKAPHITKQQVKVARKIAKHKIEDKDEKERKRLNRINNENQVYNASKDSNNLDHKYGVNKHSSLQKYINKHGNFLSKDIPKTLLKRVRRIQQARLSR